MRIEDRNVVDGRSQGIMSRVLPPLVMYKIRGANSRVTESCKPFIADGDPAIFASE